MKEDPDFIEHHKVDLAASLEATVVDILMDKLRKAAKEYKIKQVAAMIAITGYFKYQDKDFCSIDAPAYSRVTLK